MRSNVKKDEEINRLNKEVHSILYIDYISLYAKLGAVCPGQSSADTSVQGFIKISYELEELFRFCFPHNGLTEILHYG